MSNPNAVPAGKNPAENDTELGGRPAKEFKFQVNGANRVKVILPKGPRPVAKPILGTTPKGIAGFTPIRQAINLGFVNTDESPATEFTQAFQLRIRYTREDLEVAGSSAQLKLAYYVGGKWTVLACTAEPVDRDDPYSDGYLLVVRSTWPADPPVALGN